VDSPLSGDEARIKALLLGNDQAVASGLNWIDQTYRYKFCGLLRRRFPSLSPDDIRDVWQDALVSLYRMTTQGKFDGEGPLDGLLWQLAFRRGQDRLRRNATWLRPIDNLMQEVPNAELRDKWQALNELQRREIVQLICDSIARLPPRQKLVWRVYVAHFPKSQRLDYLTEQVRRANGDVPGGELRSEGEPSSDREPLRGGVLTKKAVSNALYAGREKVRDDLKRKGYDL
jgi:DNA-directed RNA polymerase specialized sigma24 family protein